MEAGEGEEGRDCLLETQEESPSASNQASPARPPPTFPQVRLTKALPLSPGAWCRQTSPRPASLWLGGCPLATWRLIQSPSTF